MRQHTPLCLEDGAQRAGTSALAGFAVAFAHEHGLARPGP